MTLTERLLLEKLYAAECAQDERNFAKDHNFEEWCWHKGYDASVRSVLPVFSGC